MRPLENCDLCEGSSHRTLLRGVDRLHRQHGDFRVAECQQCGLISLDPIPDREEISAFYPQDYLGFPVAIADEPLWRRRLRRRRAVQRRCRSVVDLAGAAGRLLDVGCGTGTFLDGMRSAGWQVVGVEPIESAAEYARRRLRLDVSPDLEAIPHPACSFDVITLWDVLEHVPYPARTLRDAHRLLKPGGWLVLSVPNPASYARFLFGRHWSGWDVPRHIHVFNAASLTRYVAAAGFQIRESINRSGGYDSLLLSIQFFMASKPSTTWRELLDRLAKSPIAHLATWPLVRLEDRSGRGEVTFLRAQKPAR